MFLVQVAADIFGNKLNFELSFVKRPTVSELQRSTEVAFSNEIALRRPPGVPPHSFRISKIKVYNEDSNKWVDLRAETQLIDSCQCYAFQQDNAWHKETQNEIPPAVRPPAAAANTNTSIATAPLDRTSGSVYGTSSSAAAPAPSAYTAAPYAAGITGRPSAGAAAAYGAGRPSQRDSAGYAAVTADPTDAEKLRVVFAEFDPNSSNVIVVDDLIHGFRVLGFDLSSATIKDLFNKGDQNHDGRISWAEFETFAKWYPIMMDCLYYRSRAYWADKAIEDEIKKAQEAVRSAEALVGQAEQAQRQAQQDEDDARRGIAEAEAEIREKQARQRELANSAEAAERDRLAAAREKAEREAELQAARDAERAARHQHEELARDVDTKDRRQQQQAAEVAKADDKVRQLEAQLAEAKRQAERAHQNARAAAQEAEQARERERQALLHADNIGRDVPRKLDAVKSTEAALAANDDRVRDIAARLRENQRDQEAAAARREHADRAAQHAADNTARMADEVERAKRAADEKARDAQAREAALREEQALRQRATKEEQELIDQEIKLREQRESLESKESKLHQDAGSVISKARAGIRGASAGYGGAVSRDASYAR